MTRTRITRAGDAVPVPQNQADAAAAVHQIGEAERARGLIQAALDETIAAAKAAAEADAAPHRQRIEALTRGLQIWAEANRDLLCQGGRKSVALATGEIGWRARPPSVRISGVEAVIERIRALNLLRFLRVKTEVDKAAMLSEPDVAADIEGVSIASAGEQFFVSPAGLQMQEPAP